MEMLALHNVQACSNVGDPGSSAQLGPHRNSSPSTSANSVVGGLQDEATLKGHAGHQDGKFWIAHT